MSADSYQKILRHHPTVHADLRGFGPAGLFALFTILLVGNVKFGQVVIPFGALLVLVWAYYSRTPWEAIGYTRPKSWIKTICFAALFGVGFKLLTKAVIMPLLGAGPVNLPYHYLAGNSGLLPYAIWAMLVAGFAEETVFRGFLFERFKILFGQNMLAKVLIVLITSIWFGMAHYSSQGTTGVEHGFIFGLVFGSIYALTGRLPFLMIAHAVYDLTALALIYWNMEMPVAHFLF